jgi:hypothetical protein
MIKKERPTNSEIIIFKTEDDKVSVDVRFEDETVWLTIESMAKLFEKSRSTINEHILHIYAESELKEVDTARKIGNSDFSTKPTNLYNSKAESEYRKYQAKTLSEVEKAYLESIKNVHKFVDDQ